MAQILFGRPVAANDNEPVRDALERALNNAPTEVLREALADALDRMRKERGETPRAPSPANAPQPQKKSG